MAKLDQSSRRSFLQKVAASTTLLASTGLSGALGASAPVETLHAPPAPRVAPNDRIRIATIGMGIIGFIDSRTALEVPGIELVAIADLYEGRRIHAKEVFGAGIDTYVDYREILARDDIDAVLVCTSDHWHVPMGVEALQAGKAVYLEKPMVHRVDEGHRLIDAQRETGHVLQIGSQYASSILYAKANELYQSGAIGNLNMIEAVTNRNSSIGAWQYSIPTDASPETVDWDRFLGHAPKVPFDPVRFFRWRNYWDYGTAAAGDLYVHLFTGIHRTLDAIGPTNIVAFGGLRHWDDGRDVPDVLLSLFAYPETEHHAPFNVSLQTNFVDGSGGEFSFRFVGDEGVMIIGGNNITLARRGLHHETPEQILNGYNSVQTFSTAQQEAFAKQLHENFERPISPPMNEESRFAVPEGYDDRYDHFVNFFTSMREDKPVYEDAVFGYRAAAPTLLCNQSYVDKRMYEWDPVAMKVVT